MIRKTDEVTCSSTSKRLSVLVLTHLFPSSAAPGRGSFVKEQCEALAQVCDVSVVTGRWDIAARTEESTPEGIRVISLPLAAPRALPSAMRVAAAVPGYIRAALREIEAMPSRPDIIHAHFAVPDGVTAVRVGARAHIPVVVTLHGSDFNRQMTRPVVGRWVAKEISRAQAIIGVSRQLAEGYARRVPQAADRVTFIHNGYNARLFSYEPKASAGPFLFIGALKPVKQPLVLIEAFARIAPHTQRDLVVIGEGPLRDEVMLAVDMHGLRDRVHLLGQIPHDLLPQHLHQAAALVLPSRTEGFGMVVIESLATGTPVIASAVGAIPDLITPGLSGMLVTPGDVDGLAAAMQQAEQTTWDNETIAQQAPVIDWTENARRVIKLYQRVLGD
ncbi:MAG: glycosyltransferase [Coriobacteriia bacterium]|nr:glycosyltransferase [Coriobacteriia bacterium]